MIPIDLFPFSFAMGKLIMDVCLGPRNEFFFFSSSCPACRFPIRSLYDYMKTWEASIWRRRDEKKKTSILFRMFYPCSGGTKQQNQWMESLSHSSLAALFFFFFFFLIFCIIFSLPHLKAIFNIRDGKRLKKKGGGGREGGF